MSLKKKLKSKDVLSAWTYEAGIYCGISVGVFDKMTSNFKQIVSVESVDGLDGIQNRVVINKAKAEKYGFQIVIE